MATVDSPRTAPFRAAARALDHAIDSAINGMPSHASGTTFVPADLAGSGRITAYRRIGPVSIVDAEENETRLPPDHSREIAIAILFIGVAVWLLARRPPVAARLSGA
jgi:hypothetical protein